MAFGLPEFTSLVILAALGAIIYALRILFVLERRLERIEKHMERVVSHVLKEEIKIEKTILKKKR